MRKVWDYLKEYDLLREDILKIVDEFFKCGILISGTKLEEFKKYTNSIDWPLLWIDTERI